MRYVKPVIPRLSQNRSDPTLFMLLTQFEIFYDATGTLRNWKKNVYRSYLSFCNKFRLTSKRFLSLFSFLFLAHSLFSKSMNLYLASSHSKSDIYARPVFIRTYFLSDVRESSYLKFSHFSNFLSHLFEKYNFHVM